MVINRNGPVEIVDFPIKKCGFSHGNGGFSHGNSGFSHQKMWIFPWKWWIFPLKNVDFPINIVDFPIKIVDFSIKKWWIFPSFFVRVYILPSPPFRFHRRWRSPDPMDGTSSCLGHPAAMRGAARKNDATESRWMNWPTGIVISMGIKCGLIVG